MGSLEAGEYLRRLIADDPRHRARWVAEVRRPRGGAPDLAAVCRVLAEHLWDTGEESEAVGDLPRRLRDRVGRALRGEVLSTRTVKQLAAAFGFSSEEREAVLRLLEGRVGSTAVIGSGVLPRATLPPHEHRTVALHEHHYLGSDGLPYRHRTLHVIESRVAHLAVYRLLVDSQSAAVAVLQGGEVGGEIDGLPAGLCGITINLARPLADGETATLEYEIFFRYESAPPPEFRRAVNSRADNVDIRVEFHEARQPARVYWCTWETLDGEPQRTAVALDPHRSAHRWLPYIEGACVGFQWTYE